MNENEISNSEELRNFGLYKHKCLRCGYVWVSRKEHPLHCANPKCHSPYWNIERGQPRGPKKYMKNSHSKGGSKNEI